jgi:acyl carrier protein
MEALLKLIAQSVGADVEKVTIASTAKDFPKWDSLRTVLLASSLEEAYKVTFQPEEIHSLTSVARIREVLRERGINIGD